MSCYKNENLIEEAIHVLAMEGFEALPKLVSRLMNEAMLIERERHLNASPYERTGDRNGYANGFKPRLINTGQGQLELQIPQVRDSNEAFYRVLPLYNVGYIAAGTPKSLTFSQN